MWDTTSGISSYIAVLELIVQTLLKLLQLQVTWPFMRKNYLVNWLPFNWCRWCCFWRMQEACGRAQMYCMVHFYLVIAFSSYSWSFEVVTFLWAFLEFTEVCFVLKVFFFWHESQLNIVIHIKPNMLIMNITILEIGIIKLFYFMCRWLSIREKSIQCKIWR